MNKRIAKKIAAKWIYSSSLTAYESGAFWDCGLSESDVRKITEAIDEICLSKGGEDLRTTKAIIDSVLSDETITKPNY